MLMLSLIGQSSASVVISCDMMNSSDMAMMHPMTASDHNMMMDDKSATNMTTDMMDNCCQENCNCATTSVNTNTYIHSFTIQTITPLDTDNNRLNIALPQTQFLNYLFKPPIA